MDHISEHAFNNDIRRKLNIGDRMDSAKLNRATELFDAAREHIARKTGGAGDKLTRAHLDEAMRFMQEHPDTRELREHFSKNDFRKLEDAMRDHLGLHEEAMPE